MWFAFRYVFVVLGFIVNREQEGKLCVMYTRYAIANYLEWSMCSDVTFSEGKVAPQSAKKSREPE